MLLFLFSLFSLFSSCPVSLSISLVPLLSVFPLPDMLVANIQH